jgi:hypothetical protein
LTEESHWYAGLASAFANNPYVWFGSMNEPQGAYGAAEAAVSFQQLATDNAIRAAGNSNIIMFECGVGSGNPGTIGARFGMTASTYATMTNIVWDLHQYNWMNHNSTNQAMADANLLGAASTGRGFRAAQTITSADGLVPVLVGETGLYSGSTNETGGEQILAADFGATYTAGTAVWHWYPSNWDNLTDNAGHLNAYGQLIAGYITRAASTDRPRGQNGTVHH